MKFSFCTQYKLLIRTSSTCSSKVPLNKCMSTYHHEKLYPEELVDFLPSDKENFSYRDNLFK